MATYIVNAATLAAFFGVTVSTIANWRKAGMPYIRAGNRGQPAEFDAPKCVKWHIEQRSGGNEVLDLNEERARLAHHQANKTALEESLIKGEVVQTLDVINTWVAMVGAARAKLLALPVKCASRLVDGLTTDEKKAILEKEVRAGLSELSGSGLPRQVEALLESSGASLEATPEAHRQ